MGALDDTKLKMKKAMEHFDLELRNLRSNRVSPNMLDNIKVVIYGSEVPLKSLATATIQDRQILLTPFDRQNSQEISKAIQQSPLSLNPQIDGAVIRVNVPPLNAELRKEIAKQAKLKAEAAKISVREIRKKSNETIRKQKADGVIAEDELKKLEKLVQELTDDNCKKIDVAFADKEKEILTI